MALIQRAIATIGRMVAPDATKGRGQSEQESRHPDGEWSRSDGESLQSDEEPRHPDAWSRRRNEWTRPTGPNVPGMLVHGRDGALENGILPPDGTVIRMRGWGSRFDDPAGARRRPIGDRDFPAESSGSQADGAPAGGTVTASDGTSVTTPAGALPSSVTITIADNPQAPALTTATTLGTAHLFGPEGQTFSAPVTVTLVLPALPQGVAEASVVEYTAPAGSSAWQPLATTVVDASHVSAPTTHFSNFVAGCGGAVAADGGAADGSMATDGGGGSDVVVGLIKVR
jgi:hypothetical protein